VITSFKCARSKASQRSASLCSPKGSRLNRMVPRQSKYGHKIRSDGSYWNVFRTYCNEEKKKGILSLVLTSCRSVIFQPSKIFSALGLSPHGFTFIPKGLLLGRTSHHRYIAHWFTTPQVMWDVRPIYSVWPLQPHEAHTPSSLHN